jgi:hypothetical protein
MAEQLKVGDLVRRDNEDIWRVISVPENYAPFRDRAQCICERAPLGWLKPDGSRSRSWAKAGDEDSFTIADLELLPDDALAVSERANEPAPLVFPMTNRVLRPAAVAGNDQDFPSIANGDDAGCAEPRRIEIEQSHGPTIAFEGKLLCTATAEIPVSEMAVYQTAAGAFVAVSSSPADEDGVDACIRASVIEVGGDNVQAAHFAVLDHFGWDRQAQAMVTQIGWSLRREVA